MQIIIVIMNASKLTYFIQKNLDIKSYQALTSFGLTQKYREQIFSRKVWLGMILRLKGN